MTNNFNKRVDLETMRKEVIFKKVIDNKSSKDGNEKLYKS